MPDFNLFAHFHARFADRPATEVLTTDDGRGFTFADIDRMSAQLAAYLDDLGVHVGDRVSVQVAKSPENLCLYLACLRAGYVFHPLNLGYQQAELEHFLRDAEPTVVVCDTVQTAMLRDITRGAGVKHLLTLDGDGTGTLMDGAKAYPGSWATLPREQDDVAALLYSSGTTGVPKGILLTHGNLLSNAQTLVAAWGFTDQDRLLHALPIFHVHGLFVATGCALLSGASMRWLANFDAKTVAAQLPECTVLMGVPTYYTRLLAEPSFSGAVCTNMRLFISGSAPLLEETFSAFKDRSGHTILERYGMTETGMNTSNPLDGERKPGTVGPPLPGVEIRIVGDDGTNVTYGEVGNLQVRGPNVTVGYWRNPTKTAEDFPAGGFFNTGDLGRFDADGYVAIVGRSKDLIITGGLNVYPKEVELFIDALSGVAESAVIGVPHADFGEAVIAVVVLTGAITVSGDDIIAACQQNLANFKVPKTVVFAAELPRNAMAKVQKNHLRENYAKGLA
jgi:malonyl-CoA/methylmalonyl-CoA synthetase